MKDTDDPIPAPTPKDAISFRAALDAVYRALTPDWQNLEERLNPASQYYGVFHDRDDKDRKNREAWRTYDEARRCADEWLQERITQGKLTELISDPDSGQVSKLDRYAPASTLFFERGNTIIKGKPCTVFFDRKSFDKALTEIATPSNKGGRPPEYDWDAIKAFALEKITVLGRPGRNNKRLPSKAQLIEIIQDEWSNQRDQHPATSTLKSLLNRWLAEIDRKSET